MAAPLKQLAKETVIYGLPSILARVLNFLFVSVYTRMLTQVQYGVVTEFLAYIAILQVVLVLGLETGCFRYANKEGEDPRKVYSGALLAVSGLNLAFLAFMVVFSAPISSALGYEGYRRLIIYVASILFCDSITAILFAKLRQEHKAVKFAALKCVKIFTEIGANLFLFFVYPAKPDFTYPIFAIFISCILCLVIFIPDILKLRLTRDWALVKRMLAYSFPLMLAGLPGVSNDFADRILFRFFDTSAEAWRASLGFSSRCSAMRRNPSSFNGRRIKGSRNSMHRSWSISRHFVRSSSWEWSDISTSSPFSSGEISVSASVLCPSCC